jgi:hypothetical protein
MDTGAYRFWRMHVRTLVKAAGVGDPEALADVLMAPLAPDVYRFQRDGIGLSEQDITGALALLAGRVLASR